MIGQTEYPPGVDFELDDCIQTAIENAKKDGDYQKLLDVGYTEAQITEAFAKECAKQLSKKDETSAVKTWLTEEYTVKRYQTVFGVLFLAVGGLTIGYLVGESVGKNRERRRNG